MQLLTAILLQLGIVASALSQVAITREDMFTEIGLYSRSWGSGSDWPTGGIMGSPGGPQVWDFSEGPQDRIARMDVVSVSDGGHGGDFAAAEWAERLSLEGRHDSTGWFYYSGPAEGLVNHGLYSELISVYDPSCPFEPPVLAWPDPMNYGDTWQTSTTFYTIVEYGATYYDARVDHVIDNHIDAWGSLIVPQGEGLCLRLNRVTQMDFYVWILFNWVYVGTNYDRAYYWLTENRGSAASLHSEAQEAIPPEDFAVASGFTRMFETNHPGAVPPAAVDDLQVELALGEALLNWSASEGAVEYRVEYSADAYFEGPWQDLGITSGTTMTDDTVNGVLERYYRVIALN